MSKVQELLLTVLTEDAGTSSRQTQALERLLLEETSTSAIRRIKSDQTTMDGGATLAVILASPALLEFAKAIRSFLERYRTSEMTVKYSDGSVVMKNVSSQNISELIHALRVRAESSSERS